MSRSNSSTRKRTVYWCVNYKDPNTFEMVQYMISCDTNTTFDQLLQEVKRVTKGIGIMSFRYTLGNLEHIIINDNRSMELAIEAIAENAHDIHQGGIIIHINENHLNHGVLLALVLYFIITGYFFMYWIYSLISYYELIGHTKFALRGLWDY